MFPQPLKTTSNQNVPTAAVPIALLRLWPGLALSAALAEAGIGLGGIGWLQNHGLSALTLTIVLGMLVGNTVYPRFAATCDAGVNFSNKICCVWAWCCTACA